MPQNRQKKTPHGGGGGTGSNEIPKDEMNRQKQKKKKRQALVQANNELIGAIHQCPRLWTHPDLSNLRNFVREVNEDPTTFPPALPHVPAVPTP